MRNAILIIQIIAMAVLFAESIYVCLQKPSRMQLEVLLMSTSIVIMFVGYCMELMSSNVEAAMFGVVINYIGKPFALLGAFLFIADYCDKKISNKHILFLALYHAVFPVIIATNNHHMLYYSSVAFDRSRTFSPLTLGHGPLYFLYMATTVAHFSIDLWLTVKEYRAASGKAAKQQVVGLMAMIGCSVVGYLVFLTGKTGGYDTTMAGTFAGTMVLSVLFIKYRIMDVLTLAKDHALDNVSQGLLVFNNRGSVMYSNRMSDRLIRNGMSLDGFKALPEGGSMLKLSDKVYETNKKNVYDKGVYFGQILEITDITDNYNYSRRLEENVKARTRELQQIQRSVIASFAGIIEARDSSTGVHVKRMSRVVDIIARSLLQMGIHAEILTEEYITSLTDIAPLHDIGKIAIPDSILLKPSRLDDEEYGIMKTHTVQGRRIVGECLKNVESEKYVEIAEEIVTYHHERWDGTGYPYGLSGEAIPLSARIIAVADVYDAIRSKRCYKNAYDESASVHTILEGKGTQFDPDVVDAFINSIEEIETAIREF